MTKKQIVDAFEDAGYQKNSVYVCHYRGVTFVLYWVDGMEKRAAVAMKDFDIRRALSIMIESSPPC